MDMRKWIQHPVRSDSQSMSSSQDKLQLQKTSVLDRVDNNETVVAPDGLGEDRPKQVRLHKYPATLFGKTNRYFLSAWYEKCWSIRWKLMRHFATLAASSVVDAWFNPRGDVLTKPLRWKGIVTGNTQQKPKKASPGMLIRKITCRAVLCGKKKKIGQQTARKFLHCSIQMQ